MENYRKSTLSFAMWHRLLPFLCLCMFSPVVECFRSVILAPGLRNQESGAGIFLPRHRISVDYLSSNLKRQRCVHRSMAAQATLTLPVADVSFRIALSKVLGYCIVCGSFFLQMPQLIKILRSKSVLGISKFSRYSEVPINSSTVIYHYLKNLPFSSYGENVVVLIQNLACVGLLWTYRVPRVQVQEIVLVTFLFAVLCAIELSLPPPLLPILIYLNLPLVLGTTLPQVIENFKQGHTGQLAILTCFLKLGGCTVRIFTTLSLIGPDIGLLSNYGAGALMNLILVAQGIVYRSATARAVQREAEARISREAGASPAIQPS